MSERHISLCGRKLARPGHICAFFDSREQEYDVLSPYYLEGIEEGEQVLTIVDAHRHDDHCKRLRAHGIPVDSALASEQLKVFTSEETYTLGGQFDAQRMYDLLQSALATAKHQGRKVRTSGVMDWSAQGCAGTEQLIDYEARVNVLVPMYDCTLLCVYDLARVSGQMAMDILTTHPYVVHRRRILENPYYVAPLDVLKDVLLDAGTVASATSAQVS
jgi:hypothetical protein